MASKEKIEKKKRKHGTAIIPSSTVNIDNKDVDSEDTGSRDSVPVVVKSAVESNIIDNVDVTQDQESNKDVNLIKDENVDKRSSKSRESPTREKQDEIKIESLAEIKAADQSRSLYKPDSHPLTLSKTDISSKSETRIETPPKSSTSSKSVDGRLFEKREQDKDRSRSPSVMSVSSKRSSSPFSRNVVEPAPYDGTTSNMGSAVSLRSNLSAKEAWSDKGESRPNSAKFKLPKSSGSTSTVVSKIESDKNSKPSDTVSLRSKTPIDKDQAPNAYIPYLYARNCIKQITHDMENMKLNHIRIVHAIEKNYRSIEDETQNQFNMFVLCLRQQYTGNVKTFKQVIEVHRADLDNKESYWKDLFTSMNLRNNKLLKDKKVLLIKHKLDIDNLVKEKEQLRTELTTMVDKTQASATQVEKDCTEKMEKESHSFKSSILNLEKQNQDLMTDIEKQKSEIDRLSGILREKDSDVIIATSTDRVTSKREDTAPQVGGLIPVLVGKEEKHQIDEERQQIIKERTEFLDERKQMENEREQFLAEKTKFLENMSKLQEEIIAANRHSAEWEVKYNILKSDISDSLTLQHKYKLLENQYSALSAIVASNTETSKHAAMENEEKTKLERDMMQTEKHRLQKEINIWETKFQEKNNQAPTEDDKPDSTKELYVSLGEVDTMVNSLNIKIETLQKVQNGTIPDPPEVSPVPVVITDPIIKTIEVIVPDPSLLENLKKSQEELGLLQKQISELQNNKSELNSKISELNTDLTTSKAKLGELERDLILARQSVTVSPTDSQADQLEEMKLKLSDKEQEIEKLRKENEEMIRDMKKMMKRYNKMEEKLKHSGTSSGDGRLLSTVAAIVKDIHSEVPTASEKVHTQLTDVESDQNLQETDKELKIQALQIIKTGIYQSVGDQVAPDNKELETQLTELEEKVIDLESENETLKSERDQNMSKILELERERSETKTETIPVSSDDTDTANLLEERSAHDLTKSELESLQKELLDLKEKYNNDKVDFENQIESCKKSSEADVTTKEKEITELKKRTEELEAERLTNIPIDSAKEIKSLQAKIVLLEKEKKECNSDKTGLDNKLTELQKKLDQANKNLASQKAVNKELEDKLKAARSEKEKAIKDLTTQLQKKEQVPTLDKKQKTFVGKQGAGQPTQEVKILKEQLLASKRENTELNNRIKQLETEIKKLSKSDVDTVAIDKQTKRHEKILKELEKKYEMEKNKNERNMENIKTKDEEIKTLNKDCNMKNSEILKLKEELESLGVAAKEGIEAAVKVKSLETDNKNLINENKVLTENFNSERVLRKKYYNMVEDMKGKIRVYCRARPISSSENERGNVSVITSPDEYSLNITTSRGLKEFQFDQVFMEDSSQEKVFEDTNNLIQSAVDGYNVCMFAYGQTGSGKTFTMIGDRDQRFPGVAPRAFQRIFELADENKSKYDIKVTAYMLELYNEKLIDLFAKPGSHDDDRLDIKKDKKGMVVVSGAVIKEASNHKELFALFEEGSKNRHVASTKMNAESSRSHLVVSVILESTNKVTGQIVKGKLSLVDLAGSERVGKTGATAEQLKEAMSINKSLSALGDVISALSSEQSFIPYRNNKLTMLMQDSLGGNAKTLMFVNISPADYNQDESVVSLTYASRVKLITNDASKNSDNKEIARLKAIIEKLKQGEDVDEED